MVISSLEWTCSRPVLLQESRKVLRIGSQSCIKFGNGDVSDLQFLASPFFIRLKYFVERLHKRLPLV